MLVLEPAITLRMSAVAAWRCRASSNSIVSRVTLDSRFATEDPRPRSAFGALRDLASAPLVLRFLSGLPTVFVARPISAPRVFGGIASALPGSRKGDDDAPKSTLPPSHQSITRCSWARANVSSGSRLCENVHEQRMRRIVFSLFLFRL